MHQPDYRDSSGVMQMPWVFLHAIKDYYDMPYMMARHEGLGATFNITPPLISQLKLYYRNPSKHDLFLRLWLADVNTLSEEERAWMIKLCKSAQFNTMVAPLESFATLYTQEQYSQSELFDLQVLFILSWCGLYLRQNSPIVISLLEKKRNYTQEDKQNLLDTLAQFISGIFDYYAALHSQGKIAIATTPLNHPILPLLMDMNNASIANSGTSLPKGHMPLLEDVTLQVERAIQIFRQTFGFAPAGFWPAEGAVDTKSVALLRSFGIKWIATDEAILYKSLGHNDQNALYSPYMYQDMCMGFRDHKLSDLIGFTYQFWEPHKASEHFVGALESINRQNPDGTVFVILDGENAWEFYQNNGYDFFDALYGRLAQLPWCQTIGMDSVLELPAKRLETLSPGSWIHGEFNTWVGHEEKTRAWEYIFETKLAYEKLETSLSADIKEKITEHFLAAECSDWFWWYGDDHHTDFALEFDTLFRSHLIGIYNLLGLIPPLHFFEPIVQNKSAEEFWRKPNTLITPNMYSQQDSFFDFIGAGMVDESKMYSTMDRERGPIKELLYGHDLQNIYFAFRADMNKMRTCTSLRILISSLNFTEQISFEHSSDKTLDFFTLQVQVVVDSWIKIRITQSSTTEPNLQVRFEFSEDEMILQSVPSFGELQIDLDEEYSQNWFI